MKKLLIITALATVGYLNLNNSTGSPGGRTGSPFHGSNCSVGCHVGTSRIATGWITTDIPSAGIVGGNTYTITLTASSTTSNKFGFELTAESAASGKEGTFTITNSNETQLTPSGTVTHTGTGTTGTNNQKIWSVDWTAPSSMPSDITFYAAVNAANGDGATSGDVIYLSTNQATVAPVGSEELEDDNNLSFYPNPAKNTLYFSEKLNSVRVFDLNGKLVRQAAEVSDLNLSDLNEGIYLVQLDQEGASQLQKLIVTR